MGILGTVHLPGIRLVLSWWWCLTHDKKIVQSACIYHQGFSSCIPETFQWPIRPMTVPSSVRNVARQLRPRRLFASPLSESTHRSNLQRLQQALWLSLAGCWNRIQAIPSAGRMVSPISPPLHLRLPLAHCDRFVRSPQSGPQRQLCEDSTIM